MLDFQRKCPGLKMCIDTGNFDYFDQTLDDAYALLKDQIVHVHCKDHISEREGVKPNRSLSGRRAL